MAGQPIVIDIGQGVGLTTPARAAPSSFLNTGDEPVKLYFLYVPGGEAQAILDAEFR